MKYLLYDNECPFCSKVIKKISPIITTSKISYIKLTSPEGQKLIKKYSLENINSVIYINEKERILDTGGGIFNALKLMKLLPLSVKNSQKTL